jgi:hypothetical protein
MKQKKIDQAILKCYQELYKNSEPSADFSELVANAKINEFGQKEIDYMAYEIDGKLMDSIVRSVIKKYKFKNLLASDFMNTIFLGCSPKTKFIK